MNAIQIHPLDNVEVLLKPCGDIPAGHKLALRDIKAGENIVKYGFPVGVATKDIKAGEWVHIHNVRTALDETAEYRYDSLPAAACDSSRLKNAVNPSEFNGYLRSNGRAGVRNEIWIIPTVGCVNSIATKLAAKSQAF